MNVWSFVASDGCAIGLAENLRLSHSLIGQEVQRFRWLPNQRGIIHAQGARQKVARKLSNLSGRIQLLARTSNPIAGWRRRREVGLGH
jgi:hypothetical protein